MLTGHITATGITMTGEDIMEGGAKMEFGIWNLEIIPVPNSYSNLHEHSIGSSLEATYNLIS
jgi:hypothetical protein